MNDCLKSAIGCQTNGICIRTNRERRALKLAMGRGQYRGANPVLGNPSGRESAYCAVGRRIDPILVDQLSNVSFQPVLNK